MVIADETIDHFNMTARQQCLFQHRTCAYCPAFDRGHGHTLRFRQRLHRCTLNVGGDERVPIDGRELFDEQILDLCRVLKAPAQIAAQALLQTRECIAEVCVRLTHGCVSHNTAPCPEQPLSGHSRRRPLAARSMREEGCNTDRSEERYPRRRSAHRTS